MHMRLGCYTTLHWLFSWLFSKRKARFGATSCVPIYLLAFKALETTARTRNDKNNDKNNDKTQIENSPPWNNMKLFLFTDIQYRH